MQLNHSVKQITSIKYLIILLYIFGFLFSANIMIYIPDQYELPGIDSVLTQAGFDVTVTNRTATPVITDAVLSNYNQFWLWSHATTGESPFSDTELNSLRDFWQAGGGFVLMADDINYQYQDFPNQICDSLYLGARFFGTVNHGQSLIPVQAPDFDVSHPIWTNIDSIFAANHEGNIEITDTSKVTIIGKHNSANMVAIGEYGSDFGKVVFHSSFVRFLDDYIGLGNNAQHAVNIAEWLASPILSIVNISSGEIFGNDTVFVPINVQFPASATYSSAEITIGGYQSGLDFISVTTDSSLTGNAGWTYSANVTGDSLLITWLAGSQDISGSGVFCWLKFVATGEPCTFVPVNIESAVFNTGTDSVTITNGGVHIEAIPDYGDADANGNLQAYDASIILKYLVGLDSLTCQGLANAEISCNDTITAYDASLILQNGVGLIDSLPWCEVLLASGDINVDDISVSAGQVFDLPINLYNGDNIYSYEGVVKYDQEQVTLTDITSPGGDFLSDSLIPGELHFAGALATAHTGEGSFAVLHFTANANFSGQTTITIEKLRLNENPVIELVATATVTLGIGDETGIPESFALHQNYPNPFNPITTIRYDLLEASRTNLSIYNIRGELIKTLINGYQPAGYYQVQWDAGHVSSGLYLYRIEAGQYLSVKKAMVVK